MLITMVRNTGKNLSRTDQRFYILTLERLGSQKIDISYCVLIVIRAKKEIMEFVLIKP